MTQGITVREKLYDADVRFTGVTEYGVSLEALLAQKVKPRPQGARFDLAFEGTLSGTPLNGVIRGTNYFLMRADRTSRLHIHASIETDDRARISFFADGASHDDGSGGPVELREQVRLHTGHAAYDWVNALSIWAVGTADLVEGRVRMSGFVV